MTLLFGVLALQADDIKELKAKLAKAEAVEGFKNSIISSDWEKALSFCSERVKTAAAKFKTKQDFFKSCVLVQGFNKKMQSSTCVRIINANRVYSYIFRISSPNSNIEIEWRFDLKKKKEKWVVDFNPISIDEQIKNLLK